MKIINSSICFSGLEKICLIEENGIYFVSFVKYEENILMMDDCRCCTIGFTNREKAEEYYNQKVNHEKELERGYLKACEEGDYNEHLH